MSPGSERATPTAAARESQSSGSRDTRAERSDGRTSGPADNAIESRSAVAGGLEGEHNAGLLVTSAPVPIESGTVVGPYVVDRRLAQGGMSVLYVARDPEGGRVVLKIVSPDIATNATRARLMREARALSLVDHPGVVRIHGTGEHEGTP